ncbi:GntR family transcriptional regulator [Psychrobacter alimentarius]|uniref:GntR family transcriptional regulator n=1 Tax=Psychrobacter alimentarius TaxID=261164 RepID=UPI003FD3A8D7
MKKFEEICLIVIDDIKSGRKKIGDKIPSIRAMSKQYNVSKNTIVNAYSILLEQRWIKALPKSGFYISEDLSSKEMHNTMLDLTNVACKTGQYRSLSSWGVDKDGNLCGSLELPMAVGLIGGATKVHPTAQQNLEILNIDSADELARITCAVGLAQNFAAMKALVTTGIQKGHMSLHAKNIAVMAGAKAHEVDKVTELLVQSGKVRIDVAEEILATLRHKSG